MDTNLFIVCVPADKIACTKEAIGLALKQLSLTLKEAQSLTGFFSFCTQAVHLGWIFMHCLWDFIA